PQVGAPWRAGAPRSAFAPPHPGPGRRPDPAGNRTAAPGSGGGRAVTGSAMVSDQGSAQLRLRWTFPPVSSSPSGPDRPVESTPQTPPRTAHPFSVRGVTREVVTRITPVGRVEKAGGRK